MLVSARLEPTSSCLLESFFFNCSLTKFGQRNRLELPSSKQEPVGSSLTRNNRTFCYFSLQGLFFPSHFNNLPKGIFPIPFNHRQPWSMANEKCKEKPGNMKSGLDAKPLPKEFGMLSMLNFLCILKIILVYSKDRFLYINWFI